MSWKMKQAGLWQVFGRPQFVVVVLQTAACSL